MSSCAVGDNGICDIENIYLLVVAIWCRSSVADFLAHVCLCTVGLDASLSVCPFETWQKFSLEKNSYLGKYKKLGVWNLTTI